ncbi:endonuclease/exonuclease/phosphatase family protein [Phycicoccus sp. CSK15P-2]|uniref:exodeoxyribonuclease III n=1 Tax=Phycicoccus sp. CSK15P-2 TaxID=2807627 RepID=UPI00194DB38E|nr:exodeoxyribonuclease III [Phycicoccus sp. CSK15P-2]MBM6402874.1 endonuclease/exonuclease/phosphatase family protein [Phycicoccus sp. CSK15P-2]
MLLASANVNGIRAAVRRGGLGWLAATGADVVTLQEVRADPDQLRAALADTPFAGWELAHEPSTAKGRAGVAVLSRHAFQAVRSDLGDEFVGAGRWVEADVRVGDAAVTVASAYVHTGEAGTERQDEKYRFLDAVGERVSEWAADGRAAVLTGDLNIAHTQDDLKNWKGNRGKSGFLPDEQAVLDRWATRHGLVDVQRRLHGPGPGPYTWWSWRGQAFDNDAGWRIDYHWATAPLAERAVRAEVGRAASYAERWSDHAAVLVDYDL